MPRISTKPTSVCLFPTFVFKFLRLTCKCNKVNNTCCLLNSLRLLKILLLKVMNELLLASFRIKKESAWRLVRMPRILFYSTKPQSVCLRAGMGRPNSIVGMRRPSARFIGAFHIGRLLFGSGGKSRPVTTGETARSGFNAADTHSSF